MIDDERHPLMVQALSELKSLAETFILGHPLCNNDDIQEVKDIVYRHRMRWREQDVDFPVLAAVVVPRLQVVHFAREDLDVPSICQTFVNFARSNPDVTAQEMLWAFTSAYPMLRPNDVSDYLSKRGGLKNSVH